MTDKIKEVQRALHLMGEKLKIGNKEYTTVPTRLEVFRKHVASEDIADMTCMYTWVTTNEDTVTVRAYLAEEIDVIINEEGKEIVQMKGVKSVGTAEEDRTASRINQTSAVENGETSAVGRLLGNLGIHGGQLASAEEVTVSMDNGKVVQLRNKDAALASKVKMFQRELSECTTKGEANTYLISKQEFLEHVRSVNENLHGELNSFAKDFKGKLSEE